MLSGKLSKEKIFMILNFVEATFVHESPGSAILIVDSERNFYAVCTCIRYKPVLEALGY